MRHTLDEKYFHSVKLPYSSSVYCLLEDKKKYAQFFRKYILLMYSILLVSYTSRFFGSYGNFYCAKKFFQNIIDNIKTVF